MSQLHDSLCRALGVSIETRFSVCSRKCDSRPFCVVRSLSCYGRRRRRGSSQRLSAAYARTVDMPFAQLQERWANHQLD